MIQDIRKRFIIIIGTSLGFILALVLGIIVIRDRKIPLTTDKGQSNQTVNSGGVKNNFQGQTEQIDQPVGDPEEIYLKQLSRIFVERFGSYSNQNDNQHINDVLGLATKKMQSYLSSKEVVFDPVYKGATTVVVASHITTHSANQATVSVDVQRTLASENNAKVEYQNGTVSLEKVGGVWKVSGLYWK